MSDIKVHRLLNAFEEAHSAYVFRGSQPPEDRHIIVSEYKKARAALLQYMQTSETVLETIDVQG